MVMAYWPVLLDLFAETERASLAEEIEKANDKLAAVAETIADILPTANVDILRSGLSATSGALARVKAMGGGDQSTDFIAGRLSAIVDILGYAISVTAADDVIAMAKQQKYEDIIRLLAGAPLRDVDLAEKLGRHVGDVSAVLDELHAAGVVGTHLYGAERYTKLTLVGMLLSEATS
jgi:hypothetical protein